MRVHEKEIAGLRIVPRLEDRAGVVVDVAADAVVIGERRSDLRWIRIPHLDRDVEKFVVIRGVADLLDLRLDVVAGVRFVPGLVARGVFPAGVIEVAVDGDRAARAMNDFRRFGGRRLIGEERDCTHKVQKNDREPCSHDA